MVDSLAFTSNNFKFPLDVKATYDVQIKNRPSIPNNIKYWQVFEDDKEIHKFLECVEEFSDIQIDDEQEIVENQNSNPFKKIMAGKNIIDLKITLFLRVWFL